MIQKTIEKGHEVALYNRTQRVKELFEAYREKRENYRSTVALYEDKVIGPFLQDQEFMLVLYQCIKKGIDIKKTIKAAILSEA